MSQTKAQLLDGKSATIQFTGGSASAPAVSFTGDTNTGIYSPGADQVAVATNGGERLRITSNGELAVPGGIGPQIRFENQHSVTTDAAISTFDDASGTLLCLGSNFYFNSSGSETRYNTSEESAAVVLDRAGIINFLTGDTSLTATSRMRITSAGLVGVGTSSPSWPLDVNGVARSTGTNALFALSDRSTGTGDRYGIYSNSNTFRVYDFTAAADRVVVDSSGNVGVGTTSPGSFNSSFNNLVVGSGSGNEGITIYTGNVDSGFLSFNDAADTSVRGLIEYNHNSDYMGLRTNGSERVRIDSSGRLGIGTSAPDSNLEIVGGTTTAGPGAELRLSSRDQTIAAADEIIGSVTFKNNDASSGMTGYMAKIDAASNRIFDGDPASGMNLRFFAGTAADGVNTPPERMRLTSAGRLGIGTTPDSPLHVVGTSGTGLRIGYTNNTNYFDANTQIFRSNNATTTYGQWDSSGRLLVGTSSGSALLQVNGTFRAGDQATSGMGGNNATILSATPPSGALAAEIHCFGKDYSTAGANNHVGLLVAYWSADTNTINTTTNINNSTGASQGFQVIWSSPNLVVRNKTGMSANQSARAWIRWLA